MLGVLERWAWAAAPLWIKAERRILDCLAKPPLFKAVIALPLLPFSNDGLVSMEVRPLGGIDEE